MRNSQTIPGAIDGTDTKNGLSIHLIPVSFKDANDYLTRHNRDYRPASGYRFTIGCAMEERLIGAIIAGRCKGDSLSVQVDGIYAAGGRAAYRMLYGAAARAAKAMGYHRIMAFLPMGEPDSGLRSACWKCVGSADKKFHPAKGAYSGKKLLRYERMLIGR